MSTIKIKPIRATTSASNIFRRKLCPGSAALEDGLGETDTEYSEEGQMLHGLTLTGQRPDTLKPEQAEALNLADYYAEDFFRVFREQNRIPDDADFIDEREVSLSLSLFGDEVMPGHADCIRNWPAYNMRAIVDFKFGYLEVDYAADNLQLASYAAMRAQQSPVRATGVCIVQPRNFGPRVSSAFYDMDAIGRAVGEIGKIIVTSKNPKAPLQPGRKQCHFCKAKAICPAYKREMAVITATNPVAIQTVDTPQLVELYNAVSFAAKIGDQVREELRTRIARGDVPGFKLANSGDTVTCENPLALYNALKSYFAQEPKFTAKAFDDCREMQWGRLTALMMNILGMSEKKAKEFINEFTRPYVTRIPKAQKIMREKGAGIE